jgi:transcription antitermination protein NusB
MRPREIARELALLGMSQLPNTPEKLGQQQLSQLVLAAVRALRHDVEENIEAATAELQRSQERLLHSEIRATDVQSARAFLEDGLALAEAALNRLGQSLQMPEFIQLTNQAEVQQYALEILIKAARHRQEVDGLLNSSIVDWQLRRLAKVDRDILRIATVEMHYLGVSEKIAINEAIELAKRYSDDEGHRFINGVLRRVSDNLKGISSRTEPAQDQGEATGSQMLGQQPPAGAAGNFVPQTDGQDQTQAEADPL